MPIIMMKIGQVCSIKHIIGDDETKRHLEHLGFILGENITVVAEMAGNLIVNIKGSRIALSKSLANKIIV